MTNTRTTPISGTVTLTSADNTRILFVHLRRLIGVLPLFLAIVFSAVGIVGIGLDDRLSLREDPAAAVSTMIRELWPFMAGSLILILMIVIVLNAIKWTRYPASDKIITYVADETGITTSNAADASVHVPWSMIGHRRKTKHYIIMKTTAGAWRFVPLRAFSPDDGTRLWQLAETHTPVK